PDVQRARDFEGVFRVKAGDAWAVERQFSGTAEDGEELEIAEVVGLEQSVVDRLSDLRADYALLGFGVTDREKVRQVRLGILTEEFANAIDVDVAQREAQRHRLVLAARVAAFD